MVVIVWSCFRMAKFIKHSTLGYQYFYVRSSIIIIAINISISRDIVIVVIICFLGEMIFELALSRFSIFCGRSSWTLRNVASKWQKVASNLGNPNTCSHPRIHTSGKLNLRISQDYKDFFICHLDSILPSCMHKWKCESVSISGHAMKAPNGQTTDMEYDRSSNIAINSSTHYITSGITNPRENMADLNVIMRSVSHFVGEGIKQIFTVSVGRVV